MLELISVCFGITLFTTGILALMYDGAKKDYAFLQRVNGSLADDNCRLIEKNKFLIEKIESLSSINEQQKIEIHEMLEKMDVHEFPVGAKISWLDRNGDLEIGEIVDDSKVDDKTFVHVRRINKRGKYVGGIISLPSNKIKLEN